MMSSDTLKGIRMIGQMLCAVGTGENEARVWNQIQTVVFRSLEIYTTGCGPVLPIDCVSVAMAIQADVGKRSAGQLEDAKKKDKEYADKRKSKMKKLRELQAKQSALAQANTMSM